MSRPPVGDLAGGDRRGYGALVHLDLGPAADRVRALADDVTDDRLGLPTPCDGWTVDHLLHHLVGLSAAFAAAARKEDSGPALDFTGLPAGWRARLDANLDALVTGWREPAAWEGEATAGGVTMPGDVMGVVALDELVLHGWDLSRALDLPFAADPAHVEACTGFAAALSVPGEEAGREGLYGPVVPVPGDAPAMTRLLCYAGRDPGWVPPLP